MSTTSNSEEEFASVQRVAPRFDWTIMIYLAADDAVANDAAFNFLRELHEFKSAFNTHADNERVRFLLQAYTDWNWENPERQNYKARRFEIDENFSLDNPADGWEENVPMGDSDTMRDFIDWCKRRCPANRYLLLLWGHGTGSGMFDTDIEQTYRNLRAYFPDFKLIDPKTEAELSVSDLTLKQEIQLVENLSMEQEVRITYTNESNVKISDTIKIKKRIRKFLKGKLIPFYDIVPGTEETLELTRFLSSRSILDALLEAEIRNALGDNEIDLLVILGCCMQMLEFGYEIRRKCNYFVASEELIYFEGYNYAASFLAILEDPSIAPRQLGQRIIVDTLEKETYTEFQKQFLVISCVNLQKNRQLAENIDLLSGQVVGNADPELLNIILTARLQCRHFGETAYPQSYIDMAWFLKRFRFWLGRREKYTTLRERIAAILAFFNDQYIIEKRIGSRRAPNPRTNHSYGGHGLGIYFPSSIQDHVNNGDLGEFFERDSEFVNLFTTDNRWNDLIFACMAYRQELGLVDTQ